MVRSVLRLGALCLCVVACVAPREPAADPLANAHISSPTAKELNRTCAPTGPELCFNATDDNCNGLLDEGCGIQSGVVQFMIAWDEAEADVDLNVTDPNGVLIEVGRVAESGLVKDRDCPGQSKACRGQNYENVYLEGATPVRGEYSVVIRLEDAGNAKLPVKVNFGARVGPKVHAGRFSFERAETERRVRLVL